MRQVQVVVTHHADMPEGLPAVWTVTPIATGVRIDLRLRADLSRDLDGHFKSMAIRHTLPDESWDSFTITTEAVAVCAVA